jgi:hypothetical protein
LILKIVGFRMVQLPQLPTGVESLGAPVSRPKME